MAQSYIVEGMSCGGCSSAVTKAIKAISSTSEVNVDLASKTVRIEGLEDEAAIKEAIEEAGFDFVGKAQG